jgi:5-methylcytosine-specific restriction endonuclease McrA
MKADLDYILNHLTTQKTDYVFFNNHPVDKRRKKYWLWRKWYNEGNLKCKCCGSEVAEIRANQCHGSGMIHQETGLVKYSFKIYNKDGIEMTFDHWIPKSFLRKKRLDWKTPQNLVLMCKACNAFKADMIPFNWQTQYVLMHLN